MISIRREARIDAVAEVLLQAGVDEIYFLCISIGEGF